MIVDLKAKGALVLPKEVLKALKIANGDKLELKVVDGVITLTPVILCPKATVKELNNQIEKMKKAAAKGQPESFDGIDAVMEKIQEKKK